MKEEVIELTITMKVEDHTATVVVNEHIESSASVNISVPMDGKGKAIITVSFPYPMEQESKQESKDKSLQPTQSNGVTNELRSITSFAPGDFIRTQDRGSLKGAIFQILKGGGPKVKVWNFKFKQTRFLSRKAMVYKAEKPEGFEPYVKLPNN